MTAGNRAYLFSTLGNVIYAQGKPEEATYPYMRVVTLFPDSSYVPGALQNAGQCLLDMAERAKDNQAASDEYLVQGMKLLAECAGRHEGVGGRRGGGFGLHEEQERLRGGAEATRRERRVGGSFPPARAPSPVVPPLPGAARPAALADRAARRAPRSAAAWGGRGADPRPTTSPGSIPSWCSTRSTRNASPFS
ncbi:MAG: hypothetical protein HC813_02505 [Planctomycetes bacterium]|nr:hypothetical protein [Planctomycetota bacterium]